jgi:hypothetical protein
MMTMKMRKKRAFMDQDLFVFAYAMPSSSDVVCKTLVSMRKNSKPEKKIKDATMPHGLSRTPITDLPRKTPQLRQKNPIIRVSPPSS